MFLSLQTSPSIIIQSHRYVFTKTKSVEINYFFFNY
jgi:hypothetical protein